QKNHLEGDCRQARQAYEEVRDEAERLRAALVRVEQEVSALEQERATLKELEAALGARAGFRLWQFLRRIRRRVAPPHSLRDRFIRSVRVFPGMVARGWSSGTRAAT